MAARDVEPAERPLSGPETLTKLRSGIVTLIDGLQDVEGTLRPSKRPSETAHALLACAAGITEFAEALLDYQRVIDRRFLR